MTDYTIDPNPEYLRCDACGWIIPGVPLDQQDAYVLPCCQAHGITACVLQWPNPGPRRYHTLSLKFPITHKDRDSTDIALVMLAIAAESALDDILWDMLRRREGLHQDQYNLIIHEHNTRGQRLKLFEKRTGSSVGAAFENNLLAPSFM